MFMSGLPSPFSSIETLLMPGTCFSSSNRMMAAASMLIGERRFHHQLARLQRRRPRQLEDARARERHAESAPTRRSARSRESPTFASFIRARRPRSKIASTTLAKTVATSAIGIAPSPHAIPMPIIPNITAASRVSLIPERNRMKPPRPTSPTRAPCSAR